MKPINVKARLSQLFCIILILSGCSYDEPPLVYDPNPQMTPTPVITRVEPQGAAFAGLTEITLVGDNFSPVMEQNVVYFNNEKGQIKSATKTEIKVVPPNLIDDNVTIKVVVSGALAIAQFSPYNLKEISSEYGGFNDLDEVFSLAMDADENLYVQLRQDRLVIKITPDGQELPFSTLSFPKASDMSIGPGGYLYLIQSNSTNLVRIGPGGGNAEPFATLPGRCSFFDFDANRNILIAGRNTGIYAVSTGGAITTTGQFTTFDIKAVRVFNGFAYVAAAYTGTSPSIPKNGVWRSQILSAIGELGAPELVFDWAQAGEFATSTLNTITFSQDGELYAGSTYKDPILIVRPDQSFEALYKSILKPSTLQMVWGNGNYLYVNRGGTPEMRRVIRIDMGKPGAPYYGRE